MSRQLELATLEKIKELGRRYGLNPKDYRVSAREQWAEGLLARQDSHYILEYKEAPRSQDKRIKFDQMLESLGITLHHTLSFEDVQSFYNKLKEAVDNAPQAQRSR